MKKNDLQWKDFCQTYWDYTYVKRKGRLDKNVIEAWWNASAGNTAFAALVFMLSQRNEIGGREIIDASAFARSAATDMAFLQPAIAALRSGSPAKLRAFDDLLFSEKYRALRKMLGAKDPEPKGRGCDEFDEIQVSSSDEAKKIPRVTRKKKPNVDSFDLDLPSEDPLAL